jgi:hypothetical protein
MTRHLLALALAAFLAFGGGVALACSCARYANAAAHAAEADVIFRGRVISTAPDGQYQQHTTFEVLETLKGEARATLVVRHGGAALAGAACGIVYRVGAEVLVIAHGGEGDLVTSSCSAPRWDIAAYRAALAQP